MKNKSTKSIFIIIISAILIMAISVSLAFYAENIPTPTNNNTSIEDIEDQFEDTTDNNTDSSDTIEEQKQPVKVYTNAFSCVSDAYKILDQGKGYKITTNITGITEVATQYLKETTILSGNYYFRETYANCTSSLGQNFYRYFYSDNNGQNVEYRKTSKHQKGVPDWKSTQVDVNVSKEEIIQKYDPIAYNSFLIRATKDNARLVKFDRTTNQKYYIVSFVLDVSKIPSVYTNNIKKEGNLDSVKVTSTKLTYYIEKDTLYIRKIEKEEKYTMKKVINLEVDYYQEQIINAIDTTLTPQLPDYCLR